MKVREVLSKIQTDGWRLHSQKGSHAQYTHPTKTGRVTIAGKPGDDVHPKTLASIFKQAQIDKE
jgi:predicted RNA binding protein YcfA (HicA-like mRNA interferase family)